MKTLKLVMIAFLVSTVAMVGFANLDHPDTQPVSKLIVNVTFEEAMQIPGLNVAMHQQLNNDFMGVNASTYTFDVTHMNYVFRITGTYAQWVWFFKINIAYEIYPKTSKT